MRHNILIVDDEQLIRQGLRARIEYLGIDVDEMFEADNGLMALGIQDAHPIDLVITDICMPDMDGLELIQQMQKKNNQIQFIVLSGYAEFKSMYTAEFSQYMAMREQIKNIFERGSNNLLDWKTKSVSELTKILLVRFHHHAERGHSIPKFR